MMQLLLGFAVDDGTVAGAVTETSPVGTDSPSAFTAVT
ncbi:hypothetical protein DYY67_0584 [Candidatus Nitrosotalea sp. TS]|nr:hypothetical protein [Candidatus Nitrosotalea sp. TS]